MWQWAAAAAAGAGIAIAVLWLALVLGLFLARPAASWLREAARILPDLLRLLQRLAADRSIPRPVRARLWALIGYLALPIDLVPDVIPVVGYVDDVILVAVVLRGVIRRAGPDPLRRHWPGTDEGLEAVWRLVGLPPPVRG